jgi:hypothetical protein
MWLAKNIQISNLQIVKKKSYKFRKTYLLLPSTSFSSAILWECQVICLPVATVAAPALGSVVAAAGVAEWWQ